MRPLSFNDGYIDATRGAYSPEDYEIDDVIAGRRTPAEIANEIVDAVAEQTKADATDTAAAWADSRRLVGAERDQSIAQQVGVYFDGWRAGIEREIQLAVDWRDSEGE